MHIPLSPMISLEKLTITLYNLDDRRIGFITVSFTGAVPEQPNQYLSTPYCPYITYSGDNVNTV